MSTIPLAALEFVPFGGDGHRLEPLAAAELGPRFPGAIYQTANARYEVLVTITDPAEAAAQLRHPDAEWAVIVRDVSRPDGQPVALATAWTEESDYLIRGAHQPNRRTFTQAA